jgi:gluconolactonase
MSTNEVKVREVATGLDFPEGPIALRDGSVLVVEIRRGTLSSVARDGSVRVVSSPGDGPNGAAIGPDGAVYVCNNGGFAWSQFGEITIPMSLEDGTSGPPDFKGGRIERIDPKTGAVTVLYGECDGQTFCGPNDLVFDRDGGFWFTDFGKIWRRTVDRGGLYYAKADGSSVRCIAYGLNGPNGVGLSPAGDRVYVAETYTGRLLAWELDAPGRIRDDGLGNRGRVIVATPCHFDSLAVEEDGTVVVAAITHGLCVIRADGSHEFVALPDPMVTNVCFGGPGRRTAYATGSATGKLFAVDWGRPGLALAHEA